MKRARRAARPVGILHLGDPLPFARIWIGDVEHAHALLARIVGHCEPLAVRSEPAFMPGGDYGIELDVPYAVGDLPDRDVFTRCAVGRREHATGSIVVRSMTTPTANIRSVTSEKRLPG